MTPRRAGAAVTFLVGLVAAGAQAGGSPVAGTDQGQQPSFRTSVDVVRLEALVLDGGKPVSDLTDRDFEVFDNGVRQRVRVESLEESSIDVVLALDTSSSVAGRLLEQLTAAATSLVDALDDRDRVALLTFSQALAIRAPLTADRAHVRAAIAAVRAQGSTSIADALSAALALPGANDRPTLLLVFSDGVDTASWLTPSQVLDQARRSETVIDGVVVGSDSTRRLAPPARGGRVDPRDEVDEIERLLPAVTEATGGRLLDGSRADRLSAAFVDAVRSFRQRYEITWTPAEATPGWHAIEVRVKGHRNATVRARPGYLR
jgi:VWFA-related protein